MSIKFFDKVTELVNDNKWGQTPFICDNHIGLL